MQILTSLLTFDAELDLNRWIPAGFKVHRLFLDPTGNHALISAVHKEREREQDKEDISAEIIYLHSGSNKPVKVRGSTMPMNL